MLERPFGRGWVVTATGTLMLPTGATPFAIVGEITADANGNLSGTQVSSAGGQVAQDTIQGMLVMNSDCTGTATIRLYKASGTLLRTAVYSVAFVDNAKELRGIMISLANGTSVPTVMTLDGRRL